MAGVVISVPIPEAGLIPFELFLARHYLRPDWFATWRRTVVPFGDQLKAAWPDHHSSLRGELRSLEYTRIAAQHCMKAFYSRIEKYRRARQTGY